MSFLFHMLSTAAAQLGFGLQEKQAGTSAQRAAPALETAFRQHPWAVMQVLVFRGQELIYHRLYDERSRDALPADMDRVFPMVQAIRDFAIDTFGPAGPGPEDRAVSFVIGGWRITTLGEGVHTLVAVTRSHVDPGRIARWLYDLALKLPSEKVSPQGRRG